MARDEDGGNPDGSPLGGVFGVFMVVAGVFSAILWHATGGQVSLPLAWLMTPVPPGVFQILMVIMLVAGLAFGCLVRYASRTDYEPERWVDPKLADTKTLPRTLERFSGPDGGQR